MAYKMIPVAFNGTSINDGTNYDAWFQRDVDPFCLSTREPIETEVQGNYPTSPRSQPQSIIMPLYVRIKATTQTALNSLKTLFDPDVGDVILTVTDGSASPVTYRLTVRVVSAPFKQNTADTFIVRLYVARPIFLNDTATSDAQTANSTPKTWTETNAGTVRTYPTITLQPTAAKSHTVDYLHRNQVVFCWESEFAGTDSNGYGYPVQVNVGGSVLDLSAEYTAGRLLANGDDLRVLVDGVEVDRWIDTSLAADYVWINVPFKPRVFVTNAVAMGNGSTPAAGEWMELSNPLGTLGLPPAGVLVFETEAVRYDAITATAIHVYARGACNTTVAAHAITTTGKWMEHEIEILTDYTGAGAAPASAALKPVIDLANSTNLYHARPGPQIYPSTPLRTGQMAIDSRNINLLSPSMRINDTGTVLEFIDSPAIAGQPQGNGVALYCPCGVKAAASALVQDVTVPSNMLARAYGTDAEGYEALLAEWNPDTDGAGVTITPSATLQRIRYAAMVRTVTGAATGDTGDLNMSATVWRYQQFTLDQDSNIYGIMLRLKKSGVPNGGLNVALFSDVAAQTDNGTTSSAPSATSMTDSTKAWATDQWVGAVATIGNSSMLVTSNSGTVLNGTGGWQPGTPSTGSYNVSFANTVPGMQFSETLFIGEGSIGTVYGNCYALFTVGLDYLALKAGKYWIGMKRSDAAGTGDNQITLSVSPTTIYLKGGMSGGGFSGIVASGPTGLGASAHEGPQQAPDWGTPTNIYTSNNSYATLAVPMSGNDSYTLKCTAFGFSVPSTATILGIVATIEMKANKYAGGGAVKARLYKAGTVGGSGHSFFTALLSTSDQTFTLGGANDLWGNALTYTDVNNAGFGIGFSIAPPGVSSLTVSVDYVTITVYAQTESGINFSQTSHFSILGDGSIVQPEAPAASGAEVDLDNINITFDDTTPRTPYCAVQAQESIYMLRGALKNDTTGQTLTALGIPVALNTIITIDTLAHTVIRSDTGANVPGLITPTDIDGWLWLAAGANNLRYTEAGIGTVVATTIYRDAFA